MFKRTPDPNQPVTHQQSVVPMTYGRLLQIRTTLAVLLLSVGAFTQFALAFYAPYAWNSIYGVVTHLLP